MLISNKLESIDFLSKSEAVLASYILNEKENIENLSIRDLANITYTSTSTIVHHFLKEIAYHQCFQKQDVQFLKQ